MIVRVAVLLRRVGVNLNWVFDPLGAIRFAARRKGGLGRPGEVEQNLREG